MPILIVIFVLCLRLFYFQPSILPRHDTFLIYSTFYHFYNHLYYFNTWPQWMPMVTYGIPALFFQFHALSPLCYVLMLAGKILGTTDVMLLFKMTILCEEVFFILSMYFLIKTVLQDRLIATAISVAAMISLESYTNAYFNLHIIYFLPLALLLMWHFASQGDSKYFWLMVLVFLLGAMGNAVYIPIVVFYLLAVMAVYLCTAQNVKLSSFWPRGCLTQITAGVSGLLILTYGLVMLKSFADLSLTVRDNHAQNSLDVFLTHGGTLDIAQLFSQLFGLDQLYSPLGAGLDNTLYVGMLIGIFFIAALMYCRDTFFLSVLTGLIFILLFSFGGLSSRLFYFLPGMSLYRHIGLTGPLIKVLVLISSGFGLKYLFAQKQQATRLLWPPFMIGFVFIEGQEAWHRALGRFFDLSHWQITSLFVPLTLIVLFLLLIFFYSSKPWGGWVKAFIVLILIMETVAFQELLKQEYPRVDPYFPDMVQVFTHVRPIHFDTTRLDQPQGIRWPMMTMVQKSGRGCNYVMMFNTLDFDTCHTDTLVQIVNKSVARTWEKSQEQKESNYQKIVGCNGVPKLALLKRLPSAAGQDIYQFAMPIAAEASRFDADNVSFKISEVSGPGWLYYADAFHPGWKAFVNQLPAKVQETADGFKALPIDDQTRTVDFHFFDATIFCLEYLLCFGSIIGLGLLALRTFF